MGVLTTSRRMLVAALCLTATAPTVVAAEARTAPAGSPPGTMSAAATSTSAAPTPGRSTVRWTPCRARTLDGLRCARMRVPLDHDRPRGATISIAMAQLPATKPRRRIGTLFVNPGGPGGSARETLRAVAGTLTPVVRARFDIVGVDPRGVGGSARLECRIGGRLPDVEFFFPETRAEERRKQRYDSLLRRACARNGGPILDHMTTADTARDMDLVRAALGEHRLTYYGISYGSHLGTVYAALFPRRVRAVLIDSVLDPIVWTRGRGTTGRRVPLGHRVGAGRSGWIALRTAFEECDRVGRPRCALAGDAVGQWRDLVRRLRREPVRVDGERIGYDVLVGLARGALYLRSDYAPLMRLVDDLHTAVFDEDGASARRAATGLGDRLARLRVDVRTPWAAGTTVDASYQGVACSDSVNPRGDGAWHRYGSGPNGFGRFWTWLTSTCARWPGSDADAYRGPWTRRPATPLLLASNRHDPATPVGGARSTRRILPGSRLVTTTGWGHGVAGTSRCADRVFTRYLLRGRLPATDVRCAPDEALFPARR